MILRGLHHLFKEKGLQEKVHFITRLKKVTSKKIQNRSQEIIVFIVPSKKVGSCKNGVVSILNPAGGLPMISSVGFDPRVVFSCAGAHSSCW